ncbi:hypothetical protein Bca4012_026352 [Brassica carinata]|uniref:Secreted protein n=1 Tax=Brassica carinata TaxID=52824 RepID=A0A8X7VIE7_BRACI|nr:hypothetical protein Bca52824_023418 [Brassica carinata]
MMVLGLLVESVLGCLGSAVVVSLASVWSRGSHYLGDTCIVEFTAVWRDPISGLAGEGHGVLVEAVVYGLCPFGSSVLLCCFSLLSGFVGIISLQQRRLVCLEF